MTLITQLYDTQGLVAEIEYCPHNRWYWLTWKNYGKKDIVHPHCFYTYGTKTGKEAAVAYAQTYHNKVFRQEIVER